MTSSLRKFKDASAALNWKGSNATLLRQFQNIIMAKKMANRQSLFLLRIPPKKQNKMEDCKIVCAP